MADYFEPGPAEPFEPRAAVVSCIEGGSTALLLDAAAIPAQFYDLSSGVAGELLHELSKYHIRLAVVVPDPTVHSSSFQAFVRESNRGKQVRFFATRWEAIDWLRR